MNKKIILKIIPFIIAIGIFLANVFYYKNLSKDKCKTIFSSYYYCIVKHKIEVIKDHDRTELQCQDIDTDSIFDLETIVIKPHNSLYDFANQGDTIIKSANSGVFIILNINRRDSFSFSCEE